MFCIVDTASAVFSASRKSVAVRIEFPWRAGFDTANRTAAHFKPGTKPGSSFIIFDVRSAAA